MSRYNDYVRLIEADLKTGLVRITFENHAPILMNRGELAEILIRATKSEAIDDGKYENGAMVQYDNREAILSAESAKELMIMIRQGYPYPKYNNEEIWDFAKRRAIIIRAICDYTFAGAVHYVNCFMRRWKDEK